MGIRTLSGRYTGSQVTCKSGTSVTFSGDLLSEPSVSGVSITSASLTFSKFKGLATPDGYTDTYFAEVYIGGTKACETVFMNFASSYSTFREYTANIDFDGTYSKSTQLTKSGSIKVKFVTWGDYSYNVCQLAKDCVVTLNIVHSGPGISISSMRATQNESAQCEISFSSSTTGTSSTGKSFIAYLGENYEVATDPVSYSPIVVDIPLDWYGKTIPVKLVGSYGSDTDTKISSFSPILPVIHPPSNLAINNSDQYTGQSATLSWGKPETENISGSIEYTVYMSYTDENDTQITEQLGTTKKLLYDILESAAKSFPSSVSIHITASLYGFTSEPSNVVTFVYRAPHKTISIYVDGEWVCCIPFYYVDGSWIECIPYYYSGQWEQCSAS